MCHPPALASYCGDAQCCAMHMDQGKMHCFRPVNTSVEQLLARALWEVSHGSLSNAILKVCVYPTKGEILSCVVACPAEWIVKETPVITVVVVEDLTPCSAVDCSKAILVAILSYDDASSWRWMKRRWLCWNPWGSLLQEIPITKHWQFLLSGRLP